MEYWNALSAIAAAATAIVALIAIGLEKRRNREEVKCVAAKECLEFAYSYLMNGSIDGVPLPDRFNWMMAARFILYFEEIEQNTRLDEYKSTIERQRIVWGYKFGEALGKFAWVDEYSARGQEHLTDIYFVRSKHRMDRSSVATVLEFSIGKRTLKDPLSTVSLRKDTFERIVSRYPSFFAFWNEEIKQEEFVKNELRKPVRHI